MRYTVEQMTANFVKEAPNLWTWGDWHITCLYDGFHLLVSSGVEYGPFRIFEEVLEHAASVAV